MKSNANSTNTSAKNNSSKRPQAAGKKSTTVNNMDTTSATERTRARNLHGGMNNEGTNVNYEEQR